MYDKSEEHTRIHKRLLVCRFYGHSVFLDLDKESAARGIISLFGRSNDTRVLAAPRKQLAWTFDVFSFSLSNIVLLFTAFLPNLGPDTINLTAAFPLNCAVVFMQ